MVELLSIDKIGILNLVNISEIDYNQLYKIANLKTKKNFKLLNTFNYKDMIFELYGKQSGLLKNKNIYKFPFENNDIYDTCLIIQMKNKEIISFNLNLWNKYINDNLNKNQADNNEKNDNNLESDSEEELDSDSELKEDSYIFTDEEIID